VDGVTFVDETLEPGEFVDVAISEVVDDYDFKAALVQRLARPARRAEPPRRSLPLATIGSYGR
jgi:hypothetical protein